MPLLRFLPLLLLCCLLPASAQTPATRQLMPVPASVQFTAGSLPVTKSFSVAIQGHDDARLRAGIDRMLRRLEGRIVMELAQTPTADQAAAALLIETRGPGAKVASVDEDESYTLDIDGKQAVLRAPTVVGALRGLETVLQLLEGGRDGWSLPAVAIRDTPRFRWRGLLIDVARHYQPMENLKRNLDAMAAVKLNVLHWHLSDNQGFRVESRVYPKLHAMGSDGLYYTQAQVKEIIAYAHARGIRVVPEFDVPGHSTAWLVGHPELGSAPGPYSIERKPGIMDPTLDPTKESTYRFLDRFFGEMAALFPDAYFHIGGDENEGKHWAANPAIQAFMRAKGIKDKHELQTHFNRRLLPIIKKHGKRMMGWDEIYGPELPKDIVIHSWRGTKALADAARNGFDGVLSNGYYIDLIYPAADHYLVDPVPADAGLTAEQEKHVLGGEATMWSEFISPENLDSRVWPRTAAIAERLWSPREVRDVDDMYRRLAATSVRLEELGLAHEKNQAMMLRRLAGSHDTQALQLLASLVEPVKQYRRHRLRPTTMLMPLTGLVDAARPDAPGSRAVVRLTNALLADAPRFAAGAGELRDTFVQWRMAGAALDKQIDTAPGLAEARPLAADLAVLGEIGMDALTHLTEGRQPPPQWRAVRLATLDMIAQPKAALEFPFLLSLRELVVAANERTAQADAGWRKRVTELAAPPKPAAK